MGLILFLALLLAAAVTIYLVSFAITALVVGFKLCVVGIVAFLGWKCFSALLGTNKS